MRTFKCFDCGHKSEVTEKDASKDLYEYCSCVCHTMRVHSEKKGIKSDIIFSHINGLGHYFNGSWDK